MSDSSFSPNREVGSKVNKYEYLKSLDTAKLQALLQQESFLRSDDKLDVELIQNIVMILDEREPLLHEPDAEHSLRVFKEEIIPQLEKETTISETPKRVKRKFITILIAAIIALFLGSSLVASAFGYNLWQQIKRWGKETFQIGSEIQVTSGFSITPSPQGSFNNYKTEIYQTLDEAIKEISTDIIVPKWIPDGYEFSSVTVLKGNEMKGLTATYKSGDNDIVFKAVIYITNNVAFSYEIDENSEETVTISGNTCYIVFNINQTGIVWIDNDIVYNIYANIDKDYLIKMVESIYEERFK